MSLSIPLERTTLANPWWLLEPTVTLRHGTSEGHLEKIMANGLRASTTTAKDTIKSILTSYLHEEQITDDLIKKVTAGTFTSSLRQSQSSRGRNVFAIPYPDERAQSYALYNYQDGGEYAKNIRESLEKVMDRKYAPRFSNSRPVVLEIDVPLVALGKEYLETALVYIADAIARAESVEDFLLIVQRKTRWLGKAGGEIGLQEPIPPDAIKKAIFPQIGIDGKWAFISESLPPDRRIHDTYDALSTYFSPQSAARAKTPSAARYAYLQQLLTT